MINVYALQFQINICQLVLTALMNISTHAVFLKHSNTDRNIFKICSIGLMTSTTVSIIQFGILFLYIVDYPEYISHLASSFISIIINLLIMYVPFILLLISKKIKQALIAVPIYIEIVTVINSIAVMLTVSECTVWSMMLTILSTVYMIIFFVKHRKIFKSWHIDEKLYVSDFVKKFVFGIILGIFISSWIGMLIPPENDVVFGIIMIVGGLSLLTCSVSFYLIPTIIAVKRKHIQKVPIILINILLGWSFIGWIVALVWACMKSKTKEIHIYNQTSDMNFGEKLKTLDKLRENGLISDEEFEQKKRELLKDF